MKPKLLDLFCGAGGAAVGYHRAGFDVIGVDINPQPDYPFRFVQADAVEFLARMVAGGTYDYIGPGLFAAVHASPPCQASSALTKGTNKGREYKQLIPTTRDLLAAWTAMPWGDRLSTVIENVQGAEVRRDLTLCGEMFGLGVIRHRYFEVTGFDVVQPAHKPHRGRVRGWRHGTYHDGPYLAVYGEGGGKGSVAEWQTAMGIDWTERPEGHRRGHPAGVLRACRLATARPPRGERRRMNWILAELDAAAAEWDALPDHCKPVVGADFPYFAGRGDA